MKKKKNENKKIKCYNCGVEIRSRNKDKSGRVWSFFDQCDYCGKCWKEF